MESCRAHQCHHEPRRPSFRQNQHLGHGDELTHVVIAVQELHPPVDKAAVIGVLIIATTSASLNITEQGAHDATIRPEAGESWYSAFTRGRLHAHRTLDRLDDHQPDRRCRGTAFPRLSRRVTRFRDWACRTEAVASSLPRTGAVGSLHSSFPRARARPGLVDGNRVPRSPQHRGGRCLRRRIMVGTACRRFALIRMVNPSGARAFAAKGRA